MKILAAYKPTSEGRVALETAAAEARMHRAALLVVRHVKLSQDFATPAPPASGLVEPALAQEARAAGSDQQVAALRAELAAFEQRFGAEGIDCEAVLLTGDGDAAEGILRLANEEDADLIVIGVRRRTPVGKAFLGSESQDILLGADCPVLAVKAD